MPDQTPSANSPLRCRGVRGPTGKHAEIHAANRRPPKQIIAKLNCRTCAIRVIDWMNSCGVFVSSTLRERDAAPCAIVNREMGVAR